MSSAGFESQWVDPNAFAVYEAARSAVAPALSLAIQKGLSVIPEGARVFEIGAGAGALRRYTDRAGQAFKWIESDHNPDFLALPRGWETDKVVARLPELPVEPESVDAVIGLGVLDTMQTTAVAETLDSIRDCLREGGFFIHMMDLSPDIIAEIKNSQEQDLFPLPYENADTIGLGYVDRDTVLDHASAEDVKPIVRQALVALMKDPEQHVPDASSNGMLTLLGGFAVKKGWTVRNEPHWMSYFGERLKDLVTERGLTVQGHGYIEEEGIHDKSQIPEFLQDYDILTRKYGILTAQKIVGGLALPGYVKATANIHILIAQKLPPVPTT